MSPTWRKRLCICVQMNWGRKSVTLILLLLKTNKRLRKWSVVSQCTVFISTSNLHTNMTSAFWQSVFKQLSSAAACDNMTRYFDPSEFELLPNFFPICFSGIIFHFFICESDYCRTAMKQRCEYLPRETVSSSLPPDPWPTSDMTVTSDLCVCVCVC